MTRQLVVDTNVVVAGLISRPSDSPVCRLLDGMLAGSFSFLLSPALLDEYRRVILRPAIRELHGLTAEQVDIILTEIVANALIREVPHPLAPPAPDRGDDHLWRLLASMQRTILVTGDRRLLEQPPEFASVVSPRAAIESLEG